MRDQSKSREQLQDELAALRERVGRFEAIESARREAGDRARLLDALVRSFQTVTELVAGEMALADGHGQVQATLGGERLRQEAPARAMDRRPDRVQEPSPTLVRPPEMAGLALGEELDSWRRLFAASPDLLALKGTDLVYQAANPSYCRLLGRLEGEIVGRTDLDLLLPDEAAVVRQRDAQVISSGRPSVQDEQLTGAQGPRWLRVSRSPVHDQAGQCVGLCISARDVTEQRETEEALRFSEERYRAVMEDQTELICRFLPDGTLTFVNEVFCDYFDKARKELIGQSFMPVMPAVDREAVQNLVLSLTTDDPTTVVETRVVMPGGHVRWLRGTVRARFDQQGQLLSFQCVARDITDRQQMEQQLRRGQKMQAIGQLASGCAHHFNNLLTVINGYAQFMINALEADSPLRRDAEAILKAGERAASLTSQLLAFGCPVEVQTRLVDLNEVVKDVGEILHSLLGEDIVLKIRLAEDLGMVRVNPGQMEVVVLNLVTNARDAMPSGGVLALETTNVELDEAYVAKNPGVKPGNYVTLVVTDSGCGMTPEVRDRIFEPFFTTKEPGTSTGMGLATVYGIVEQADGHIQVFTEPGLGTTFKIHLPRVDSTRQLALPEISEEELPRGSETILVLEDQDQVREFTTNMLKHLGYKVLSASNGNDALALCLTTAKSIDLLLTDVVMPNMSGPEFVARLRQLRQGFEVIYMSGYTGDTVANYGDLGPEDRLLQKPFTIDQLAHEVRRALNRRPA